jgi:hypothetical protein
MSAAYANAAIPEPYRILGLRLKPLCLGHYLHMARFNVGFVSEDSVSATIDDLVLGVLICSKTYQEFLDFLEQDDVEEQVKSWGAKCIQMDVPAKVKLFLDYITQGSVMPKYWDEGSGQSSGAHWTQSVKLILTSELGYTNGEALNIPLTQAFADFFKFCESKGTVRLMTVDEIAQIEAQVQAQKEAECLVK